MHNDVRFGSVGRGVVGLLERAVIGFALELELLLFSLDEI